MWLDAETFLYYQASELVPFKISSFLSSAVIKKLANPGLFLCKFLVFSNTNFTYKTESFSGIWTRILTVEGEYDGHMNTTTAQVH